MNSEIYRANAPLPLAGARNVRDLGGYPAAGGKLTRTHAFLRADSTAALTDDDVSYLIRYGVRCVVDLRSEQETQISPSRLEGVDGIDIYKIRMLDQAASENYEGLMPENMAAVYLTLLDHSGARFTQIMEIFARYETDTVLFNCSAGKDRTGMTAMFLLLLAGVPEDCIVADYSTSAQNMKPVFDALRTQYFEKFGKSIPDGTLTSDPADIRTALSHLKTHYGSAEEYLLRYGTSPEAIAVIRRKLLG